MSFINISRPFLYDSELAVFVPQGSHQTEGVELSNRQTASYNTVSNNTANNNVMNGIEVQGDYNTISSNTAFSNNALGRYDPDGYPWYYDIMISSPLPNTNTLEGNAYGTIYIY